MLNSKWHGIPSAWWLVIGLVTVGIAFAALNAVWNRKYVFRDGLVAGVVGHMGSGKSLFMVTRILIPFCRALSSNRGLLWSPTQRPVRRVVTNFKFNPHMKHVEVVTVGPTATATIFDALVDLAFELGATEGPWTDPETGEWVTDHRRDVPAGVQRQPILNALVVLDEMHLYVSSSKLAMRDNAAWLVSMARKLNIELWWVTQNEMKIHKRLRDDSTEFWLASKLTGPLTAIVGSGWHGAYSYMSAGQLASARTNAGTSRAPRQTDRRVFRYTKRAGLLYNSFQLIDADPTGPVRNVPGVPIVSVGGSGLERPPEHQTRNRSLTQVSTPEIATDCLNDGNATTRAG